MTEEHKPLTGTQRERLSEALVRVAEQILARMYTEVPMSEVGKEAAALKQLTEAWLMLDTNSTTINEVYVCLEDIKKALEAAKPVERPKAPPAVPVAPKQQVTQQPKKGK